MKGRLTSANAGGSGRQGDPERRAFAEPALDGDDSMMLCGDPLHQAETEACAFRGR